MRIFSTTTQILYDGLDKTLTPEEFNEEIRKVNDRALDKIVRDTLEGKINWKRDLTEHTPGYVNSRPNFYAKVTIENTAGKKYKLPVSFSYNDEVVGKYAIQVGKRQSGIQTGENPRVTLGDESDERIKRLIADYFKVKVD